MTGAPASTEQTVGSIVAAADEVCELVGRLGAGVASEDDAAYDQQLELMRQAGVLVGSPLPGGLDASLVPMSRVAAYASIRQLAGTARQASLRDYLD